MLEATIDRYLRKRFEILPQKTQKMFRILPRKLSQQKQLLYKQPILEY